jgi:hypothetical protein
MTTEIRVGSKHVAIVDDCDVERVLLFRWHPQAKRNETVYARTEFQIEGVRTRLLMHRLILDARPGQFTDHVDGNGLHNWRSNIRLCTHAENARNSRKHKVSVRSPYKGVYAYSTSGKWLAVIRNPALRRQIAIGVFDDPVAAARAYDIEARRLFGEFAAPNFPDNNP